MSSLGFCGIGVEQHAARLLDLLLVERLIIVADVACHCDIICILNNDG